MSDIDLEISSVSLCAKVYATNALCVCVCIIAFLQYMHVITNHIGASTLNHLLCKLGLHNFSLLLSPHHTCPMAALAWHCAALYVDRLITYCWKPVAWSLLSTQCLRIIQKLVSDIVLDCVSGLASRLASGKAEESVTVEHVTCFRLYAYSRNTELNYANDWSLSDVFFLEMWLIIVTKNNVIGLLQYLGFKNRKVWLFFTNVQDWDIGIELY